MNEDIPPAPRAAGAPRENTAAELDAFAEVCERLMGFEHALSPYRIDGWLTVLAASPVRPPVQEWLPRMCADAFDRAFADPPDRARAIAVLQTRLLVLYDEMDAEALLDQPDDLRLSPFLDAWTDEDRQQMLSAEPGVPEDAGVLQDGALWAAGVLDGLDDLAGLWDLPDSEEVNRTMGLITEQIEGLLLDPASDEGREFIAHFGSDAPPERDDLISNACFALQDLRVFLLDHGPRPDPRRVVPQPGRNDLCPCGSGRKYKKCHGAAA